MNPRCALYCRQTSTGNADHQLATLEQIAVSRGWTVVRTFADQPTTAATVRCSRSALDAVLSAASHQEIEVLVLMTLGVLGQSLRHLIETVNTLKDLGVDLYVHDQGIDTTSAGGKSAFTAFAALAQYEQEQIRERARTSLERARRNGRKLGRPTRMNSSVRAAIIELRARQVPVRKIATQLRVGVGSVYRATQGSP